MQTGTRTGSLAGVTLIEFAGVGPGPFCAMLLADMGANVVTLDRKVPHGLGIRKEARFNPTTRGRRSIAVDLKSREGRVLALKLLKQADGLIESNRPGVMERLGLGPDACWAVNPRLVYGRMTGWGQDGPLAQSVGHDLNFLALSGMLSMIGTREKPAIPSNFLADYAGGGLYLAIGVLAALIEARCSGRGQVVDAAMIDGLGSLMTHHAGFLASGRWIPEREANFLDGGAPWYNVYETSDGLHVSVAPIEPKFYAALLQALGIDPASVPDQLDKASWPAMRKRLADIFRTRTRREWSEALADVEACFAPVLSPDEAAAHPHLQARAAYIEVDGVRQPAPAPRFSRTPSAVRSPPPNPGADSVAVLRQWGFSEDEISRLKDSGTIA